MRSDAALLKAVTAGDQAALKVLWLRHAPSLRRRICRLLPSEADADDLMQDVLLHLAEKAQHIEHPKRVRAYLAQVAVRTSFNLVRKQMRRRRFLEALGDLSPSSVQSSQAFIAADILARVGQNDRRLLIGRHAEGHTLEQLSTREGLSLATLKRRLKKATENVERICVPPPGDRSTRATAL